VHTAKKMQATCVGVCVCVCEGGCVRGATIMRPRRFAVRGCAGAVFAARVDLRGRDEEEEADEERASILASWR
jgi:hypothetical protein